MYSFVTFCLVSCMAINPHKPVYKHVDLNTDYFPSIQRTVDTTKKDTAKHSEELPVKEVKTLIIKSQSTGDTCIEHQLNLAWQKLTLRLLDSARNISGVTTAPTISIGTNSTSYNNIVTGSLLNTLLSTLGAGSGAPQNSTYSIPITGGTPIYVNVSIAAVATSYNFTVEVIGFYDQN